MGTEMKTIAKIHTEYKKKFGIPRQSGIVEASEAKIVFEPKYRNADALRGLEEYSHIWLLWEFSENIREGWSPTVRPPRLGGNRRKGVFATRSPFRPNPIGLSCVKLKEVIFKSSEGPVLIVSGADMLDGTPIYDIKPYLPFSDSQPDAVGGFSDSVKDYSLNVVCPKEIADTIPNEHYKAIMDVLAQDPRPSYQHDPNRVYGMKYADMEIRFTVDGDILTVTEAYYVNKNTL
ncbi:MAG: tRNA (N6-threonylcarbamoyladenosine(37)-N6)-methyltransferase TrmO [Clostridiales bacterium]|nr:tRNA (N6-threonylcarbamoyladenosine(37)-N6)-methyltransferase TrmO [Clostridiales bacterium]